MRTSIQPQAATFNKSSKVLDPRYDNAVTKLNAAFELLKPKKPSTQTRPVYEATSAEPNTIDDRCNLMGHFFTEGNIESVESAHKDGKEIGMEVTDFDYLQTTANQVSLELNTDFTSDIRTDISFADVHLNLVQEEIGRTTIGQDVDLESDIMVDQAIDTVAVTPALGVPVQAADDAQTEVYNIGDGSKKWNMDLESYESLMWNDDNVDLLQQVLGIDLTVDVHIDTPINTFQFGYAAIYICTKYFNMTYTIIASRSLSGELKNLKFVREGYRNFN